MANEFVEILSPGALADLQRANQGVTDLVANINRLNAAQRVAGTPSQFNAVSRGANRTAEEIANNRLLARNANQAALANSALAGAYGRLNAQTAIAARRYQELIVRGRTAEQTQRQYNNELRRAQAEFTTLNQRVIAANRAIGRYNDNVGNYPTRAIAGIRDLVGAFGVAGGIYLFAQITKDIFNTTRELQGLDLALRQVLGTQEGFTESQQFLQRISEAYGVEINNLTRSYTGFYAASKNAIDAGAITATQIQDIFESVSKASGAMGLSVEQQQGAFLALQQMISKGNVQAEEIRGQLAERLPGAFGILAKSMGVTEMELNKLLKDGKVLAAEVLPAFARELERAYGVENLNRVESLNAATTRLGNAWTDLIRSFSEGDSIFTNFLSNITEKISDLTKSLADAVRGGSSRADRQGDMVYNSVLSEQLDVYKELGKEKAKLAAQKALPELENDVKRLEDEQAALKETIALEKERSVWQKTKDALSNWGSVSSERPTETQLEADLDANIGALAVTRAQLDAAKQILEIRKRASGLGGKTEKVGYEKPRDYLAAQYEANKRYLEYEKQLNKEIVDNTENSFADREAAAKRYFELSSQLALSNAQEEERQINFRAEQDIESVNRRKLTAQNKAEVIDSIEKKSIADVQTAYENYGLVVLGINKEIEDSLKDVYKNLTEQERKNKLDEQQIANLRQIKLLFQNVDGSTGAQGFVDIENSIRRIGELETDASIAELQIQKDVIQQEIDKISKKEKNKENNEAINKLLGQQLMLESQILSKEKERVEAISDVRRQTEESMRSFLEGITGNALNDMGFGSLTSLFDTVSYEVINSLGEIEKRTGSTFQMLFDQADTLGEKFSVAFNTFADFSKQTLAFVQQNQAAAFDAELVELEKQKGITEGFAESEEARDKISRDFEERRRDIRRREAEASKNTALFNAGINIAQGITAALATGPSGIPLAAVIGALGLIQISAINAREIPAYKMGTNFHPGGDAVVGDGYKRELIHQPKSGWSISPSVPTLMSLERGTKVYPDLMKAGVMGANIPKPIKEQVQHVATVSDNKPTYIMQLDKSGIKTYISKGHTRRNDFNNKVTFKGTSV